MPEVSRSKRDPRTPTELEHIFPGRMWVVARKAAEHGWDVAVRPTAKGWALFLTEDHHCIHLFWQPNQKPDQERYPWDLHKSSVATRCPNGGRVHIKDLPDYLANHPDECVDTHTRVPLHEMSNRQSCEDHLCPVGAAAARRDPLDADVVATVDVVDVAEHARKIYGGEAGARAVLPPDVPYLENDYRFELNVNGGATSFHRGATADDVAAHVQREKARAESVGWTPGDPFHDGKNLVPGYVAGTCGHRVAQSEWKAGFKTCERC